jgi:hypothetical protein
MGSSAIGMLVLMAAAGLLACGRADTPQAADEAARGHPAPADGDTVDPFTIRLGATGCGRRGHRSGGSRKAPPSQIGGDVPTDDVPLPERHRWCIWAGTSEHTVDSLPPGRHRIIAVFASGDHVPMPSVARDTVTVIVH